MNSYDDFKKEIIESMPVVIRIDRKDLINQLRALKDNNIEILVYPKDKRIIYLQDRGHRNMVVTRN